MSDLSEGLRRDVEENTIECDSTLAAADKLDEQEATIKRMAKRIEALVKFKNELFESKGRLVDLAECKAERLQTAVYRIEDMLEGNDGQAWKEARKFLEVLSNEAE